MPDTLDPIKIQQKAFLSTIKDGTSEIFQALLLGIAGMLFLNLFFAFIGLFFIILLRVLWIRVSQKIKEQYIFPRIGYFELKSDHKARLKRYQVLFALTMVISIVVFFLMVYIQGWKIAIAYAQAPVIVGGAILGRTFYFYLFSGKWQYLGLGFGSSFLAIVFIVIPFPLAEHHIIFFAWTEAIVILVIGTWKLHHFVTQNPISEM